MRSSAWILIACLVFAGLVASGCGARQTSAARQTDIQLPAFGEYVSLALSRDGFVWVADSFGSFVRVSPGGLVAEYRVPEDELDFPGDLVAGPDGAMWFTTGRAIGRIDATGKISSFDLSSDAYALTSVGDGFWSAGSDADGVPRIERVNGEGFVTARVPLASRSDDPFTFGGIAPGPDGTVWFTESSYEPDELPDAVGRVARDGSYRSWPLPGSHSSPTRITVGPDEALWFTEELGHRIGRITTTGDITEYPLRPEVNPTDIAAGRDHALWFTSDSCIGRITTGGDIAMWPVARAKGLVAIEAAPDGSFWLLDAVGHAVRHFTPPKPAVASEAPCQPPTVEAEAGTTRAVLVYKRLDYHRSYGDFFTDARIRISRHGKEVFSELIPPYPTGDSTYTAYGYSPLFAVRDLDDDGEPEVRLELSWNGTHCCEWSRIYRFDASRGTYVPVTHFWGEALASPNLQDVDDDGRPEFVSKDSRFAALTGIADVWAPIQIWSYDHGRFSDVTRSYPKLVEQDAAKLWRSYQAERGDSTGRYVLAAWAADEYMLDRAATVERVFAEALERGELAPHWGEAEDGAANLRMLKAFLRKNGYIPR